MATPKKILFLLLLTIFISCNKSEDEDEYVAIDPYPNVTATFGNSINLNGLDNYANQTIPVYITKDNTVGNPITDKEATLGRVLFYDKSLSADNTISCSSCHIQANAFGDTAVASVGMKGLTDRHSMRLVNSRFSNERKFFWDERAANLEAQITQPIQNHIEMGFSGTDGDSDLLFLINKLQNIGYYKELFAFVYGDEQVTESRIQNALAQFIRSIQSFDSKYDIGRAQTANDNLTFDNFTDQENLGKRLFLGPPQFDENGSRIAGGAGCAGCHAAPEFSINPNSRNNGVIGRLGNDLVLDLTNTKAPTLRDVVKTDGTTNGPLMHNGVFNNLQQVIAHYNFIDTPPQNDALDHQLSPVISGQQLNLTTEQMDALAAFIKTLAGTDVYVNPKWGNPF